MIAFVFESLTSRSGLLSNPVNKEVRESYSKYIFSDLPCDYHVYIVGDNECYETACEYFGKERVKGFVNVMNHIVEHKQYYVKHPWMSPENSRCFPQANFNNCNLFYKMNLAKNLIETSGFDYKCIITLRSDLILLGEYQSHIIEVINNDSVIFFSTRGTINIGKPDIMKNFIILHKNIRIYLLDLLQEILKQIRMLMYLL